MKTRILILIIGIVIGNILHAQQKLSLVDAIHMALDNNSAIQQSNIQAQIQKTNYMQTAAAFLPSLDFEMSGIHTTDPLASFGFKLKQEIVNQNDFNPALLNDPSSLNHHSMKLQIHLPILNMDAITQRNAAKLGHEASKLKHTRVREIIKFQVKKGYYELDLSQKVISVIEESQKSAKASLELTLNNFEQGFLKEADVLMAKVYVEDMNNKLAEAQNNYEYKKESFLKLIGMELESEIILEDIFTSNSFDYTNEYSINNRSDIEAFNKGVEAKKELITANLYQFLPRINAFGTTEWNDNQAFGTQATNYTIGAVLSWKLFNGQRNIGSYKKAKLDHSLSQESLNDYIVQSIVEYNQAKRDLKLRYDQIQTAKLNKEYAHESNRMIRNRYEQGLEKTIDVLYAETLASNRELSYLQAQYAYMIQQFYFELLTEKEFTNL
jgi:outer membrane protein TolC